MALLQTTLDAVEVGLAKMVVIVCRRDAREIHAIKATGRSIWLVLLFQHFCD